MTPKSPVTTSGLPPGAALHEELAQGWSARYENRGFRRRRALFRAVIARRVRPGTEWIDVGCGTGTLACELARAGASGVAVDGSPAMVALTQLSLEAIHAPFRAVRIETVESLPFAPASFDGALCSSVIEYVEHPDALLDEIFRVLRPGGVCLISFATDRSAVRTVQGIGRRLAALAGMDVWRYLTYLRTRYDEPTIRSQLQRRGLVVLESWPFDPLVPDGLLWLFTPAIRLLVVAKEQR